VNRDIRNGLGLVSFFPLREDSCPPSVQLEGVSAKSEICMKVKYCHTGLQILILSEIILLSDNKRI
jgi:hypothetical protein